jgi:hypothetical protein
MINHQPVIPEKESVTCEEVKSNVKTSLFSYKADNVDTLAHMLNIASFLAPTEDY